jgi:hypothetical protein
MKWLAVLLVFTVCKKDGAATADNSGSNASVPREKAQAVAPDTAKLTSGIPSGPLNDITRSEQRFTLKAPAGAERKCSLRISGANVTQAVTRKNLTLSTDDLFLKIDATVECEADQHLSLSRSEIDIGQDRFGLARDVQRLTQSTALEVFVPGGQPTPFSAYFEVSPQVLKEEASLFLQFDTSLVKVSLKPRSSSP